MARSLVRGGTPHIDAIGGITDIKVTPTEVVIYTPGAAVWRFTDDERMWLLHKVTAVVNEMIDAELARKGSTDGA